MFNRFVLSLLGWMLSCAAYAINPYIHGDKLSGASVQAVASAAESKLEAQGFKLVGKYFIKGNPGVGTIVVTDAEMLKHIGEFGEQTIVGAGIRIGIKADGTVSYMNPQSATGRRCACTRGLEYDHVRPVALGGDAAIDNVRLLCRRHNQLEAERRLGAQFMRAKRVAVRRARSLGSPSGPGRASEGVASNIASP